ncbi:hypothetical protein BJV82DRAFT_622226 [Fennellomyces sp. T-0311]|nr:hypothetical protein BJV82DRAFT_622226 [Fennellomyces sp. T-0311]
MPTIFLFHLSGSIICVLASGIEKTTPLLMISKHSPHHIHTRWIGHLCSFFPFSEVGRIIYICVALLSQILLPLQPPNSFSSNPFKFLFLRFKI